MRLLLPRTRFTLRTRDAAAVVSGRLASLVAHRWSFEERPPVVRARAGVRGWSTSACTMTRSI